MSDYVSLRMHFNCFILILILEPLPMRSDLVQDMGMEQMRTRMEVCNLIVESSILNLRLHLGGPNKYTHGCEQETHVYGRRNPK